jgi:hypothetical protein
MINVKCIYPTVLERGGYIDRDEVVSITEAMTHSGRIQRNFRNLDGTPIVPCGSREVPELETATDLDSDIASMMQLTREDLARKALAIGLAVSSRMNKETIARMIVEAGVPPTMN